MVVVDRGCVFGGREERREGRREEECDCVITWVKKEKKKVGS